jgi:hypothetical protein
MPHRRGWESIHRTLGPVSLDDLATRWAYREGIHLAFSHAHGAQRALEIHLAALNGPARKLGDRWASARRRFCARTGLPDPRAASRIPSAVWWVRWLAERGWASGDELTSAQYQSVLEDLMSDPDIHLGRLIGASPASGEPSPPPQHTMQFARASARSYVLVATPTRLGVVLELRAYRSTRREVSPIGREAGAHPPHSSRVL